MRPKRRTDLQILVQALTAVQYEIRSLVMVVKAPDEVLAEVLVEVHELQVDAKTLMQSALADADKLAFMKAHRPRSQQGGTAHRAGRMIDGFR